MMMHPSYTEMIEAVNAGQEDGTTPVAGSRYSIVMATSHRARQIVDGDAPLVENAEGRKALSVAAEEVYEGKVKILQNDAEPSDGI